MKNIKTFSSFLNESSRLDQILDKISDSGMESLTRDELNYLNSMSNGTPYTPENSDDTVNQAKPELKRTFNDDDTMDDEEDDEDEDFDDEDEDLYDDDPEYDYEKIAAKAKDVVLIVADLTMMDKPWYEQFMEDSGGSNFAIVAFTKKGELIDKDMTEVFPILKDCDLWDEVEGYMSYDPSGEWDEDELIDELIKIGFNAYSSEDPEYGHFLK
jgi:hypothetical protein